MWPLVMPKGGILEFGIEDGMETPDCLQRIQDSLMTMLVNNINGKTNGVQISAEKKKYDNGGETILLFIRRSVVMATTSDGKVFMRNGDNSEPITGEDLHRLSEEKDVIAGNCVSQIMHFQTATQKD